MKDFDFDELDRAVNSALSGANVSNSTTDAKGSNLTNETVVNLDGVSTSAALVEPMTKSNETPLASSVSTTSATPSTNEPPKISTPPASRRSSGRFMDIVHASSDMRPASGPIAPIATTPVTKPEVTPEVEEPKPEVDNDTSIAPPLESPFLPDAKVEKRPLGGPMLLDEPDEPRLEAPDEPRLTATNDFPDPIDFNAPQTVSLEENEEVEEAPVDDPTPEVAEGQTTDSSTEDLVQEQTVPEEEHSSAPANLTSDLAAQKIDAELIDIDATVEPETYGPTSITQQYKEQPSTTAEPGAIYDTESYHQPLSPAPKKKSGLLVAGIVLLLLVLGAGLGAVFYLYVLPML